MEESNKKGKITERKIINNNDIETVAHQTLEELSRIQSTSDIVFNNKKQKNKFTVQAKSKCSSKNDDIDPSELQSTSRANIYKSKKLHTDISSSSISSKSSNFDLDENNCSDLIIETNRKNEKLVTRKKNRKPFLTTCEHLIDNTKDQPTHRNNVLEIEQINLDEQNGDDSNENDELIHRLDVAMLDRLDDSEASNNNIDYLISLLPPNEVIANETIPVEDPIEIRGNGNITLFGLSNCYTSTFPSSLLGRVSKEEFEYTINRINNLLQQQHSTNAKFLLLGCLCCCFSLGCSLFWPTFALSKRTKNSLEKLLAIENSRLYNKLGLNWRLSKQPSHTNHLFMEYILIIDFLPKMHIYQPD